MRSSKPRLALRRMVTKRRHALRLLSIIFGTYVLLLVTPLVRAGYGEGDPRLEKLFATFISPCCWRENLTAHQSPEANRLRARIQAMTQDGRSDDQIKATLVGEYGRRILSLPEGGTRLWLFWTPVVLAVAGVAGLLWILWRSLRNPAPPIYDGPPAELGADWDD